MIIKNSFLHDVQRYSSDGLRDKAVFEQLSADLTKAGIENKFTYLGAGSGSSQYISVNNSSHVQQYAIEWVTAVYNGGNYKNYGVSNASSYEERLNMWLEFQLNGVKYLLGTYCGYSMGSSYSYFYLYTDATSKPNTEGNTIENFYLRRFHRINHYYYFGAYNNTSYVPNWTITKFKNNLFIQIGTTSSYKITIGYMQINEQYGQVLPEKDNVFCAYPLSGNNMINFTPIGAFNTCLAGNDEGDTLTGTIPMSEMFLGIKNTGVICKFNDVVTLPYNYAETRQLRLGNQIYRKVPLFDYCYYLEE